MKSKKNVSCILKILKEIERTKRNCTQAYGKVVRNVVIKLGTTLKKYDFSYGATYSIKKSILIL